MNPITHIDFYISVIDNYGDMGFAVNLAISIHDKYPNVIIRFFSNDALLFGKFFQKNVPEWIEYIGIETLKKTNPLAPAIYIYNFFDYPLPKEYLSQFRYQKTIISFSYFLLHMGLESLHKTTYVLESGYDTVIHFVPSLLPGGGGIIINPLIEKRRGLSEIEGRKKFLEVHGLKDMSEKKWVSIFIYPETMEDILEEIAHIQEDIIFFIFGNDFGLTNNGHRNMIWMPFLSLENYSVFQSLCDANVVRGENSLCQSLISGKPTLWDIYKESNIAHEKKIEDYLLFLGKQFPETRWEEYGETMRMFNGQKGKELVFLGFMDFVFWYSEYEGVFGKISEYIKIECDLVRKLEEILK